MKIAFIFILLYSSISYAQNWAPVASFNKKIQRIYHDDVNNDLYLPRISKDGIAIEAIDKENSRLLKFDRAVHVKALVKKDVSPNGADEIPFKADSGSGSDFEL